MVTAITGGPRGGGTLCEAAGFSAQGTGVKTQKPSGGQWGFGASASDARGRQAGWGGILQTASHVRAK